MKQQPIRVAVVGAGYWGINHVRMFANEPRCELVWICDASEKALQRARKFSRRAKTTTEFAQILENGVDAVVIATPATSHARLTLRALEAGKHVLVEKPLALNVDDALAVQTLVKQSGKVLLVGHLMIYHVALRQLRQRIANGELGDIYYLHSRRVNLGRLRTDENALWSFAPHDLSMIDYLLAEEPINVAARGQSYLQPGIQDVVFLTLRFAGGQMAHVHLSWLDPRKERRLTVVGSRKMVEFDDVSPEKLRIYDKGYDRPPSFTQFDEYLTIRQGDIHIPHVNMEEPLGVECRHFLECIAQNAQPLTGIDSAVRVVRLLQAAQVSLDRDGAPVVL